MKTEIVTKIEKDSNENPRKNWKELTLEKIAELSKEVYLPNHDEELSYIGLEHIDQQTLSLNSIGKSTDVTSSKFRFKNGDILFGKLRPYFRKVYRPKFSGICSTDIWVVRAKSQIDQSWLFYLFTGENFIKLASGGSSGTRMPRADWHHLKDTAWLVPELFEQKRIAEILSSLDDKIELNRKINNNLEKIASLLFKQWFIDIDNDLPKGWKIKPLQEVFDFLEGPGIRNWQYSETGTRFINIRLINKGDIDVVSANYINQKDVDEKYQHFLLEKDDLVLSASGTLGRSAIVRKNHLPLLLNTSVIRFRPRDGISYPFMYQYLHSSAFLKEQVSLSSGSVQANFGPTHLKQMSVIVPDDETLAKFNKICGSFYKLILFNLDQNNLLQRTRDSLLSRLMSGKIRVNEKYE